MYKVRLRLIDNNLNLANHAITISFANGYKLIVVLFFVDC